MTHKVADATLLLQLSLSASTDRAFDGDEPVQRRMAWLGSELERLSGEAYRLADEAGDDEGASPVDWSKPIPGFDEPPKSS